MSTHRTTLQGDAPGPPKPVRLSTQLELGEATYSSILHSIDQGFCIIQVLFDDAHRPCDYRFLETNPTFETQTGLMDPVGKTALQMVPDLEPYWIEMYGKLALTGEAARFVHPAPSMGRCFDAYAFRIGDPESRLVAVIFTDITERKQVEEALAEDRQRQTYLLRLTDRLRPLGSAAEVLHEAARVLGEHLNVARVGYAEDQGDDATLCVRRNYVHGVRGLEGPYRYEDYGAELLAEMRSGRIVRHDDIPNDHHLSSAEKAAHLALAVAAKVDVPLVKDGRLVALLFVHHDRPRRWTDAEVALMRETAERTWDAVERARAEAELRQSRTRLEAALRIARLGTFEWDLGSNAVTLDDRSRQIFEFDAGEGAEAGQLFARIHPDDRERVRREMLRSEKGAAPLETEFRILWPEGETRTIVSLNDSIRDSEGKAIRVFGVFGDVTARRHADVQLAKVTAESARRKRLYETILSNTPDFAYVFGLDRRFMYANEVLLKMWGKTWDEAIGKTCLELGYPDWHAEMHDREIEQVKATKQPIRGEVPFHGTFGPRIYDYIFVPVLGPDGEVEAVAGTTRDVTERKLAEEQLRASEERFRAFMDFSPTVSWITDTEGQIRYLSATYTQTFQVPEGNLIGASVYDMYPREFAEEYLNNIRSVNQSGKPLETMERAPRRDGSIGRFLVYKFPLPEPGLVGGVAVDITERLDAEEKLREADRKKDEFLALLAHELRNPLAPLRNGLHVLRLADNNPDMADKARGMMERQLSHMVRLIDDLLDVSRISSGKLALRKERVTLSEVIAAAVETARPLIDAAGHELAVRLPGELIVIEGDLTRLAQVFSNLLANSAKYTPRGGRISIEATGHGDHVEIRVADNGIGIPAESLPRIFDMFSQVDRSIERSTGGLGIGLALVRGLVDMHGGTVSASSEGADRGSTFFVNLPMLSSTHSASHAPTPVGPSHASHRRVLVVDDNRDSAESMAMMLHLLAAEVYLAHDGIEAVAAAEHHRPEIVLMDVGMPRLNGLDATRRIREQPWGRDMTIIALTGWGQDSDRLRSREAGCDGHLVKPVELSEMEQLLARLASGRSR